MYVFVLRISVFFTHYTDFVNISHGVPPAVTVGFATKLKQFLLVAYYLDL